MVISQHRHGHRVSRLYQAISARSGRKRVLLGFPHKAAQARAESGCCLSNAQGKQRWEGDEPLIPYGCSFNSGTVSSLMSERELCILQLEDQIHRSGMGMGTASGEGQADDMFPDEAQDPQQEDASWS